MRRDERRACVGRATRDFAYASPMAGLSRDAVAHVAHLARLGLTDEELTRLEGQLNHILDQYAVLAELDTDHIEVTQGDADHERDRGR